MSCCLLKFGGFATERPLLSECCSHASAKQTVIHRVLSVHARHCPRHALAQVCAGVRLARWDARVQRNWLSHQEPGRIASAGSHEREAAVSAACIIRHRQNQSKCSGGARAGGERRRRRGGLCIASCGCGRWRHNAPAVHDGRAGARRHAARIAPVPSPIRGLQARCAPQAPDLPGRGRNSRGGGRGVRPQCPREP